MSSKDVRNMILTLIILAAAIFFIGFFMRGVASDPLLPSTVGDLPAAFQSLANLVVIGIIVLVLILLPVYLSKRSQERKYAPSEPAAQER